MKINEIFYSITLSQHAQVRSQERQVSLQRIMNILKNLSQALIDGILSNYNKKFAIVDKRTRTTLFACIKNCEIVIITVIPRAYKKLQDDCFGIIL